MLQIAELLDVEAILDSREWKRVIRIAYLAATDALWSASLRFPEAEAAKLQKSAMTIVYATIPATVDEMCPNRPGLVKAASKNRLRN